MSHPRVGWLGAVGAFLALAVAGLTRQDIQTVRAAYVAVALTTWFVIVPTCKTLHNFSPQWQEVPDRC